MLWDDNGLKPDSGLPQNDIYICTYIPQQPRKPAQTVFEQPKKETQTKLEVRVGEVCGNYSFEAGQYSFAMQPCTQRILRVMGVESVRLDLQALPT